MERLRTWKTRSSRGGRCYNFIDGVETDLGWLYDLTRTRSRIMFNLRCIKRWGRTETKHKSDIRYGGIFPGCVQKDITSRKIWVSFKALFFRFKFFQSFSSHHFSRCSCFDFLWDPYWRCSVAGCVFKLLLKWAALFIFNFLVAYCPFTFVLLFAIIFAETRNVNSVERSLFPCLAGLVFSSFLFLLC